MRAYQSRPQITERLSSASQTESSLVSLDSLVPRTRLGQSANVCWMNIWVHKGRSRYRLISSQKEVRAHAKAQKWARDKGNTSSRHVRGLALQQTEPSTLPGHSLTPCGNSLSLPQGHHLPVYNQGKQGQGRWGPSWHRL